MTTASGVNYWIRPNKSTNFNPEVKKLWDTKNTKQVGVGDKIIFYISGYKKFAGIAEVKSEMKDYEFELRLNEDDWVDVPPKDFLMNLDFVKERNFDFSKNKWKGLIFQSTTKISKEDFTKLRDYILKHSRSAV